MTNYCQLEVDQSVEVVQVQVEIQVQVQVEVLVVLLHIYPVLGFHSNKRPSPCSEQRYQYQLGLVSCAIATILIRLISDLQFKVKSSILHQKAELCCRHQKADLCCRHSNLNSTLLKSKMHQESNTKVRVLDPTEILKILLHCCGNQKSRTQFQKCGVSNQSIKKPIQN